MTEEYLPQRPPAIPDDGPRPPRQPEANRRPSILGYLAVALACLAIGAAAVYLAFRAGWITAGTSARQGARTAAPSGAASPGGNMAGLPGMTTPEGTTGDRGSSQAGVFISPARQQLIGVRTAPVERRTLVTTIRTVGTLAYDESRVTQMNTKVAGWIERVYVDYVGKPVRRGEPLFSVYSPDLVATQSEYLLALKARDQFASSHVAETRASSESLLAATRERLKLWDVTDAQVTDLERTRQPRRTLTLFAPFDGIVLERNAFAGQYITPDTAAFKLADLSTLWVIGQVFEFEMGQVAVGQEADIEFPYGEHSRRIKGRIGFIYPDIDPQTRRGRVRVEFPNPSGTFKPGAYVTVSIQSRDRGARVLAVPKEAVIDTGVKQLAIVAHPNGYFEPRAIEAGQPTNEFYPITNGLAEGDQVVTSAQFLIDSEANLQAAMQAMSMSMPGMDMGGGKKTPATPTTSPAPTKAAPSAPPGEMPGMPGMRTPTATPQRTPKSPDKTQAMDTRPGAKSPPTSPKAPGSMDDMPGMPGMDMPTPAKPATPAKTEGRGGSR